MLPLHKTLDRARFITVVALGFGSQQGALSLVPVPAVFIELA